MASRAEAGTKSRLHLHGDSSSACLTSAKTASGFGVETKAALRISATVTTARVFALAGVAKAYVSNIGAAVGLAAVHASVKSQVCSAASTVGAVGITREALGAATTVAAGDSGLEVKGLAAGSTLSPISVQLVGTLPLVGNVSTKTAAVSVAQAFLRFAGDAACQGSVLGAAQAGGFVAGAAIAAAKTQAELDLSFELSGAAAANPTVQLLVSGALDFTGVAAGLR